MTEGRRSKRADFYPPLFFNALLPDRSETTMAPLVSVIIPTYNRWPMLGEAIDSVLVQSFRDFELMIVDDGSSDETTVELGRYGSRLKWIRQERRGVAAARNKGARHATGRYLAFLDSDDLWCEKKLESQVAFMAANPAVQICQTEEIWIRNGVRVNPKARHRKPSGDIFRRSLELCLVSPSAVMMTRSLFEKVRGFDESMTVCEDYDLWLRVASEHSVLLIPKPLVVKRGGHPDQLSHSTWAMDRFRVRALRKLLRSPLSGERRIWAIESLKKKVAILSQGAAKRGRRAEALGYEAILSEFLGETANVGSEYPRVRNSQGLSSADCGPLVEVG